MSDSTVEPARDPAPTEPLSSDTDLRRKQLERLISAAASAISRSRATWLLGITITFVFGVHLYNVELSQNYNQIKRKAHTLAILLQDIGRIQAELQSPAPDAHLVSQLSGANSTTGYLAEFWKRLDAVSGPERRAAETQPGTPTRNELDALRYFAQKELDSYVQRRVAFDTVTIPVLGVSMASADFGRLVGAALAVIGFWLVANVQAELLAIRHFTDRKRANYPYTPIEGDYAVESIRHEMVFIRSDGELWRLTNIVTLLSFLLPPALLAVNFYTTVRDLRSNALGNVLQPDVLCEFLLVLIVTIVWGRALRVQARSIRELTLEGIATDGTHGSGDGAGASAATAGVGINRDAGILRRTSGGTLVECGCLTMCVAAVLGIAGILLIAEIVRNAYEKVSKLNQQRPLSEWHGDQS